MKHKKHNPEEVEKQEKPENEASAENSQANGTGEAENEKVIQETPPDSPAEREEKETAELKKQVEESCNRLLRMQADFDNYKKRVARERDDMFNNAVESIAQQLLPVVDNMERAAEAFRKDQLDEKYVSGVEMVFKQLIEVLERNGIKEIEALDKEFDPNIHHAVMQVPGEDENKVKEVFQKGYILGTKVIRPTLVKVSVKQ